MSSTDGQPQPTVNAMEVVLPASTNGTHERPNDHWTTVQTLIPHVQPAAMVIKMGFNKVFLFRPVTHYSVIDGPFPRKRLRDGGDEIKAERLVGLRRFSSILVTIRLSCVGLALQFEAPTALFEYYINHIYVKLSGFLHVPEPQVHQELRHVIGKISPHISPAVTRPTTVHPQGGHDSARDTDGADIVCAICLDGIGDPRETVELVQCGHLFHKECVGSWLQDHCTCPLCRTMSFDEEFMVEYVTQTVLTKSHKDILYLLHKAHLQFTVVDRYEGPTDYTISF
ncbi:hypothetical protein DYB32_010858 [Aphanomyces invadans]|uniref:RING-type domain-containing protein n=1 Tax=Aphanomyces invadans TaxID=157072 RepID=A0A418AEX6_9STRA|nr:hypothetical protein DYB32_010858 [Aphanomyces invadans]